jgi:hypothetical protein
LYLRKPTSSPANRSPKNAGTIQIIYIGWLADLFIKIKVHCQLIKRFPVVLQRISGLEPLRVICIKLRRTLGYFQKYKVKKLVVTKPGPVPWYPSPYYLIWLDLELCRHQSKMSSSKIIDLYSRTLRQVFIKVYRPWRYSQSCWYIRLSFVNCCPSPLLSGSTLPLFPV